MSALRNIVGSYPLALERVAYLHEYPLQPLLSTVAEASQQPEDTIQVLGSYSRPETSVKNKRDHFANPEKELNPQSETHKAKI